MRCSGNAEGHCCWFGEVCKHLEENTVPGRRWACGLFRKYGSWGAVYETAEWQEVYKTAISCGLREGYRCGEWPYPGEKCHECGGIGDG